MITKRSDRSDRNDSGVERSELIAVSGEETELRSGVWCLTVHDEGMISPGVV